VSDPILLYGTRADGSQAPVAIDSAGRVRINGLGEKGDPGEPGPPGPPGEGGEAGGPGAAATVAIGNVTTGAAGSAASVSNTGTAYEAVLDFVIPRGEGGEAGGPGAAATVAVGNVTTGAAGSAASVSNTGTAYEAVLDFAIPRGDKGETGPQGPARDNSGQQVFPANGAASTPPVALTGSWFAGGTSTTTKPQFLVEPAGTSSTSWNTAGTGFGVNAPTNFQGSLFDMQAAGSSYYKYTIGSNAFTTGLIFGYGYSIAANNAFNGTMLLEGRYSLGWATAGATLGGTPNIALCRDGEAGVLAQRAGNIAQVYRLYNTWSSSTSFERLNIRWTSSELVIETEAGSGGGTLRGIKLGSAATSLLGFYGATPVVRPAAVADATDAASAISQLNAVLARLRTLGLIAT
jgi:hypothetical protein